MDFNNLNDALSELKDKMRNIEQKIKEIKATCESGAGLVKATVNGKKEVLSITLAPEMIPNAEDRQMVEDLVVAAVNLAIVKVTEKVEEETQSASMDILQTMN